jgi:hypothetical protein
MKLKIVVMLSVFFTVAGCFGLDTDVKKFFNIDTVPVTGIPADQIYPKGRLFPFSFYSTGGGSEEKREELLPETKNLPPQKVISASSWNRLKQKRSKFIMPCRNACRLIVKVQSIKVNLYI